MNSKDGLVLETMKRRSDYVDQLLCVTQVSKMLGCSKPRVYSMIAARELGAVKILSPNAKGEKLTRPMVRIKLSDVIGLIESNYTKAAKKDS